MINISKKQWNFLVDSAKLGKISHAYLFVGPQSIEKKRVAFDFAKFLNCQKTVNNQPCNHCQVCYQIEKKIWPNLIFIEPENSLISIEKIRQLKEKLSLTSEKHFFKIAIIEKAHLLTFDAQSALLKQLEEPKGRTVIILLSEYPFKILPTIRSRCQRIEFLSIFDNEKKAEETEEVVKRIERLKYQSIYSRFLYAKEIAKNKKLEEIIEGWLYYFRELMHKELKGEKIGSWSKNELKKFLSNLQEAYFLITTSNVKPQLILELLFLDL
ncbi:MAG: hypothetical protein LR000_00345 [Candidatus Pacebacteria bacterium]|nr:hypothetical protein [Candidatus Paceibacterota bacterium]